MTKIRIATDTDQDDVRHVHLSAFPEDEREIVSQLAVDLLFSETDPVALSWVAETEGTIVGHVAFSPVIFGNSKHYRGYLLAPLAVHPDHQKHRIGSQLVKNGLRRLTDMGVGIVFVYGDPKYYGRFGFTVDAAEPYEPPYELHYPFGWQALVLREHDGDDTPTGLTCVGPLCNPDLW